MPDGDSAWCRSHSNGAHRMARPDGRYLARPALGCMSKVNRVGSPPRDRSSIGCPTHFPLDWRWACPVLNATGQKLKRRPNRRMRCGAGVLLLVLVICIKFAGVDTFALGLFSAGVFVKFIASARN